jgi:hypothetical protein
LFTFDRQGIRGADGVVFKVSNPAKTKDSYRHLIQDQKSAAANLDYRPAPSNMALSRVPGDENLYVGGYVPSRFTAGFSKSPLAS